MNKIIIKQPKIIERDDGVYLESSIIYENNKKYDLWFKVEKEYKDYLCYENSDAFLTCLIPYIVKHNCDIEIEGSISSKLYYHLTTYLLPMLCNTFNKKNINIKCDISFLKFNPSGVGASFSGGVDSFYTLLKHKNLVDNNYNITHLTFFNAGSHGQYGGDKARELYYKRLKHVKEYCKKYNYKYVCVDSNMNEFIMMNHLATHSFRTLGCVLALQKLFKIYYFASGHDFNCTKITPVSSAYYDILNVQCLSNDNVNIYSSGIEATRMDKIKYISKYEETFEWLNVCIKDSDDASNCSICEKCQRTLTALESIGKLNNYKNVFNLNKYKKNRTKILAAAIKNSRNKVTDYQEILATFKKNDIHIPLISYILSFFPNKSQLKSFVKKIIPKNLVKKIRVRKGTYIEDGWED